MKNFKLTISYDGSRYSGWERQPGRDTIQGKLEPTRACMQEPWLQTAIWKQNCSRTKSEPI